MNLSYRRAFLSVLALSLVGLLLIAGSQSRAAFNPNETIELSSDTPQKSVAAGFDFSSIDRTASACQDFNRFANGGWMDKNPIPPAYSRWGRFEMLDEQNLNVLHGILEGLMVDKKFANGNEQKIADFYGSCMDEQKIEAEGIQPLEPELQRTLAVGLGRIGVFRGPAAAVPQQHGAAAILALGDHPFEPAVIHGVVLDMNGEPLLAGIEAGTLRHRPALQDAIEFEAEIVMQAARGVLLYDK